MFKKIIYLVILKRDTYFSKLKTVVVENKKDRELFADTKSKIQSH